MSITDKVQHFVNGGYEPVATPMPEGQALSDRKVIARHLERLPAGVPMPKFASIRD